MTSSTLAPSAAPVVPPPSRSPLRDPLRIAGAIAQLAALGVDADRLDDAGAVVARSPLTGEDLFGVATASEEDVTAAIGRASASSTPVTTTLSARNSVVVLPM